MNFSIILILLKISDRRVFSVYANNEWQIRAALGLKKCNSHSDKTGWFKDGIHVPTALLPRMELQIKILEMSL